MTILIFLAVLFVLILVHEWGHYITAKWTGMRVDEFGIGFPPKLFGFKRGETEYTLNALPIGGFVKILGENGDSEGETLSVADQARTFSARPKWAQAIVLIAGVTMNVLLAWVIFFGILVVGTDTQVSEEEATEAARFTIVSVVPDSPASVLPLNAEVLSAVSEGRELDSLTPSAFVSFVREANGSPITLTYSQDGVTETVTVTPSLGVAGAPADVPVLGLQTALLEERQLSIGDALREATLQVGAMLKAITVGLIGLLSDAVMGTADFSQVAGPVGIVEHVGTAASFGIASLLYFTAIISLNLAVINLFPIPALDGGRLVFVAIEAVTRRPINPVWAGRMNLIGFGLLMLLMVVVTYNDILKLL